MGQHRAQRSQIWGKLRLNSQENYGADLVCCFKYKNVIEQSVLGWSYASFERFSAACVLGIIFQQTRNKIPWRFVRSRSCINFPGNLFYYLSVYSTILTTYCLFIIIFIFRLKKWVAHRVAHRVAHGLAHGPWPRFCLHPLQTGHVASKSWNCPFLQQSETF